MISRLKKFLKPALPVVYSILFVMTFLLINEALEYVAVDDVERYTRLMMHELYHQEENIDILFLGSSRCYRSLDTSITDTVFDENTFNAGSSAQCWDGSYALLVEAGKKNDLKKVYVEIGHNRVGSVYKTRKEMTSTYIISDYMRPSINKINYLLNASGEEHWLNSFFPLRRNWKYLYDVQKVLDRVRQKNSDTYRNYHYWGEAETDIEYYAGKGYVARRAAVESGNYSAKGHLPKTARPFSEDDIASLEKIIRYCHKNGIELVLFASPVADFLLADAGDYDLYIQQASDFAEAHDVEYYDFNICKEEYFSYESGYYCDTHHLNKYGAEAFSRIFSRFFVGEISQEELFYPSYNAKMQETEEALYGLIYKVKETDLEKIYTFSPVQNRPFPYKAAVFKKANGADAYEEIQAAGVLNSIQIPIDEKGELLIHIFDNDIQEISNRIIINY